MFCLHHLQSYNLKLGLDFVLYRFNNCCENEIKVFIQPDILSLKQKRLQLYHIKLTKEIKSTKS